MLDKRTAQMLSKMANICADGSYKIIDKAELSNDDTAFSQSLQYLRDNELIDDKYVDDKVCCVNVLPKGRVSLGEKGGVTSKSGKSMATYIIIGCFVAGFVGGFLGAFLGGLL